ncbi:hypothetical protein KJ359_002939 [Pestalotiopsis sp. 9143b]|nr:hypothetical protein KJ359_002939 [Pestalotiopsis sp. 9143b]
MSPTSVYRTFIGLLLSSAAIAEPVVKSEKSRVTYRGTTKNGVEHFQNIRYAHDTSGPRRFAPPEPYTPPRDSAIDATAPGKACPQSKDAIPPFFDETPEISEDCLTLRIARPVGAAAGDRIPVVVWVHGGAVVKGSAYDSHFEPDRLITLSESIGKPVIYVAINYRLTIFGFARLSVLRDQHSLNAGMRDQRAAFQWVRDNIAEFGGDPTRITAYGLSAGGTATSLQLVGYGGERGVPFTQMWAMSGPPGTAINMTSDATEIHTLAVAEKLGCGGVHGEKQLSCLRGVPMQALTDVATEYAVANHPPFGGFTFIPSVDGDFLPDRQSVLYKSGKFVKAFAHALSDDDLKQLFALYPTADFDEEAHNYQARRSDSDPVAPVNYFRVSRIMRDLLFTCSSIDFGHEISTQSKAVDPAFAGVRLYDLNQSMLAPMFQAVGMPYVQTSHGSDTHYIFNGLFPEGEVSELDRALSTSLTKSFINFAYTGDPTVAGDEHFAFWPESLPVSSREVDRLGSTVSEMDLLVVGGPLGTGNARISREESHLNDAGWGSDPQQQPLDDVRYGVMKTFRDQERTRLLEKEKLIDRCAFIAGLSEKLGV